MQSALHSRYRGGGDEPITARTNLYTCLCIQEFDTLHLPDQVQDQVACLATPGQGVRRITGPLTEGPGPTSNPGSLPAPRVACHCSPASFHQQHGVTVFRLEEAGDGEDRCDFIDHHGIPGHPSGSASRKEHLCLPKFLTFFNNILKITRHGFYFHDVTLVTPGRVARLKTTLSHHTRWRDSPAMLADAGRGSQRGTG
jgi:hypothetical protein